MIARSNYLIFRVKIPSNAKMIEAAELALENALAIAKEGTELGKIGSAIEKTIKAKGFNPIQNLSGHGLARFEQRRDFVSRSRHI